MNRMNDLSIDPDEAGVRAALRQPDERLAALIEIASDWYWEQDEHYRFTYVTARSAELTAVEPRAHLGRRRWDQGAEPFSDSGRWDRHIATLDAREPFSDFVIRRYNDCGEVRYISSTGVPVFDRDGRFAGYRGLAKDVTARVLAEMRLTLQHGVTRALAESDDLAHAATGVLQAFCTSLGWEGGACFVLDTPAAAPRCLAAWAAEAAVRAWLPAAHEPAATPLPTHTAGGSAWLVPAAGAACLLQTAAGQAGAAAVFSLPIRIDGEFAGVMEFISRQPVMPDPGLHDNAALIGHQVGQFWQRLRAQDQLRDSEQRFRHLTELSSDCYWEQDDQFRFTALVGSGPIAISAEGVRNKTRWELPITMSEAEWAEHRATLEAHQPFRDLEYEIVGDDGQRRFHNVSGVPVFDEAGRFKGYHGVARDISARKHAEQRIQYLATHDDLTGLPNRTMFSTVLNMALNSAQRYQRKFALVFIDLDRFKVINDTLGHEAGDELLRRVASRLKGCLRASDLVARMGGDEFVVLVQEITETEQAAAVAQKILLAINQPLELMRQECRVTASVGVSLYPTDAQDELTLMKNADLAMYLAKEEGKNNYQFFSPSIKAQSVERLALEAGLRHALERDELFLHYQAKLDLHTGRITGAEALLRWRHPELGMVSPAQFIPLAEETGLIVPIGLWVLRTACRQAMAWQRAGLPPLCIAVNLSPRQFNDEHLLRDIQGALDETGLAPEHLELEITEGMVMQDSQRAARILAAIKSLGVMLAIDDFGTGYSSLAQIKRFPFDTIKVDRSFIRNLPQDTEDKAITQAIIAIAKTLSLTVVAEGVETAEQEAFLREHACDQTQGYYFCKPIAAEDFAALLSRHVGVNV